MESRATLLSIDAQLIKANASKNVSFFFIFFGHKIANDCGRIIYHPAIKTILAMCSDVERRILASGMTIYVE